MTGKGLYPAIPRVMALFVIVIVIVIEGAVLVVIVIVIVIEGTIAVVEGRSMTTTMTMTITMTMTMVYLAPQAWRQACIWPRVSAAMMQQRSSSYSFAPMTSRSTGPS